MNQVYLCALAADGCLFSIIILAVVNFKGQ
jgi:hypothetical protein